MGRNCHSDFEITPSLKTLSNNELNFPCIGQQDHLPTSCSYWYPQKGWMLQLDNQICSEWRDSQYPPLKNNFLSQGHGRWMVLFNHTAKFYHFRINYIIKDRDELAFGPMGMEYWLGPKVGVDHGSQTGKAGSEFNHRHVSALGTLRPSFFEYL